jgi:hypothetical protein
MLDGPIFIATPDSVTMKRGRGKLNKANTPLVQASLRRNKRTCVTQDGHRPKSLCETTPRPRKKSKSSVQIVLLDDVAQHGDESVAGEKETVGDDVADFSIGADADQAIMRRLFQ